jgi:hypothetical protein
MRSKDKRVQILINGELSRSQAPSRSMEILGTYGAAAALCYSAVAAQHCWHGIVCVSNLREAMKCSIQHLTSIGNSMWCATA